MITFNPNCKTIEELKMLIDCGHYDDTIRKDMIVKLRDGDLKEPIADCYDMHAQIEDVEYIVYVTTDPYYKKSALENELTTLFSNRVNEIRAKITAEIVKTTFKDYVNADKLFLDIEKNGFPKVVMNYKGVQIFAQIESIEKHEFHIVLKSGNFSLKISHLSDCLKKTYPNFILKDYQLCYGIYGDFDFSGVQLVWYDK